MDPLFGLGLSIGAVVLFWSGWKAKTLHDDSAESTMAEAAALRREAAAQLSDANTQVQRAAEQARSEVQAQLEARYAERVRGLEERGVKLLEEHKRQIAEQIHAFAARQGIKIEGVYVRPRPLMGQRWRLADGRYVVLEPAQGKPPSAAYPHVVVLQGADLRISGQTLAATMTHVDRWLEEHEAVFVDVPK